MKRWSWLACCSVFLLVVLMATTARAQGPYVSVQVGSTWLEDADNAFKAFPLQFTTEYDLGFNVGAASGYDYGLWRAEIELAYRQNDLDTLAALGSSFNAGGDLSALSLMLNGFVDLPTPGPLTPYLGGGLGMAWVSANDVTADGDPVVDDDDAVFAYQLAAGLGWELMPKVTLDLGYRFFATTDPEFTDVDGDTFESEYMSHNLMAGLRLGF
jgi:opacity protein-like surface antigen